MSREILEAVRVLEREKGISSERLMAALEDALLSATRRPQAPRSTRVWTWHATAATSSSTSC